jgi:hypothetical protein
MLDVLVEGSRFLVQRFLSLSYEQPSTRNPEPETLINRGGSQKTAEANDGEAILR